MFMGEGAGGANSDDWREGLAFYILCATPPCTSASPSNGPMVKKSQPSIGNLRIQGIHSCVQDEVQETIHDIRRAGIHIWMLTGDKKETAMNLAHSAGILRQEQWTKYL